jgi:hypothetical protein
MKKTLEKLQKEKELQDQYIRERESKSYNNKKEIETMQERMTSMGSQFQELITIIANSDDSIKNRIAKKLVESHLFKPIINH